MGRLIDGTWTSADGKLTSPKGDFVRQAAKLRNWITVDGSAGPSGVGGFPAESGRYHLYVSEACPWAHRTLIFRKLKGLENHIAVSVVHPDMFDDGWTFATDDHGATGDRLMGLEFLREVYQMSDPQVTTRVSVPVLWDSLTRRIVSNESSEIIRMFNSAFDGLTGNNQDFWPQDMRQSIQAVNDRIYDCVNNGVHRAGFASDQRAYDDAVGALFETLDWLEERLAGQRYLMGKRLSEADWRLFPTLTRFDAVYHIHFKCSRDRLVDYPNLWAFARELYQWPGVAATVNFDHISRHYYHSHSSLNPRGIVAAAPRANWNSPHERHRKFPD